MFSFQLRRDIILLILIKAMLLMSLYFLFFSHAQEPSPAMISSHLTGTAREAGFDAKIQPR